MNRVFVCVPLPGLTRGLARWRLAGAFEHLGFLGQGGVG